MKVLLVKCHKKTPFTRVAPIITEPLELEYLSSVLDRLSINHRLYDVLLEGGSFEKVFASYEPNILVLTGYITTVDTILAYAKYGKSKNPDLKVLVGGVHAEINGEDFFVDSMDVIVHSDGLNTFEKVLNSNFKGLSTIDGIAYHERGKWHINKKVHTHKAPGVAPLRSYFNQYKNRTKYLNYSPLAIVKTALSCPFQCNFCYCRLLNNGHYVAQDIESVVAEIQSIDSPYIWIVDDTFLVDRDRVLAFIDLILENNIHKKFIAYSRADFIVHHEDIIEKLATIGFIELIVGMEAVDDHQLGTLDKGCSADENEKAIGVLRKYGIGLTALFIVGIDFTLNDFQNLRRWIRKMALEVYTLSIFTPMKGTEKFDDYIDQIQTWDYGKWDFLHLVLKPTHMDKWSFYFQFYLFYMEQCLRSREIRKFIIKNLKNILFGGNHG